MSNLINYAVYYYYRRRISTEDSNIAEVLDWYTSINRILLEYLTNEIKETDNSNVWR